MGWARKVTGIKEITSKNITKAALVVGGVAAGGAALGAWGGGASAAGGAAAGGAGAGMGGAGVAIGSGAGFGGSGLGALGSGMFGAVGSGASSFGLGAGLGGGLSGLGGAALGGAGLMGGMTAAEMLAAAYPAIGSSVAGGLGGALGSGFFGTGISDIGALMGTTGGGGFSLGSGLYGVGKDIMGGGSSLLGGWGSPTLSSSGRVIGNSVAPSGLSGSVGRAIGDGVSRGVGVNSKQSPSFVTDPYANETAKFARQAARPAGEFWDANRMAPTVELDDGNWMTDALKKQGIRMATQTAIKSMLPQPQMGMQGGGVNIPPPVPMAPVSTGRPASLGTPVGGLTAVGQVQSSVPYGNRAPQPTNGAQPSDEYSRQLRNMRYDDEPISDVGFGSSLQSGQGDSTLAGYDLWRALRSA